MRAVSTAFMGLFQRPEADGPYRVLGRGLSSPIALVGGRRSASTEERVEAIALARPDGADARHQARVRKIDDPLDAILMKEALPEGPQVKITDMALTYRCRRGYALTEAGKLAHDLVTVSFYPQRSLEWMRARQHPALSA